MNIGAIVTVAGQLKTEAANEGMSSPHHALTKPLGGSPFACHEILGQTLLQRTLLNLRSFGIKQQSVLFEESGAETFLPSRIAPAGGFFSAWENAIDQQLRQGADLLLLIRLGAYLEIDFSHLLRFHRETSSALTQVYDHKSAFEVAIVSANQLESQNGAGSYRGRLSALIPYHRRYIFRGYSNRLREPQDLRRLVQDALLRRNSIRPIGDQVSPDVWLGKGAEADPAACISAPAYIGDHTRIKSGCTINGVTAIERECVVDFGTTVTDSCVLQGTYLGMGLNVSNSIAAPGKLFNLARNIEVDISDRHLIGKPLTARSFLGFRKPATRDNFFERNERQTYSL